MTNGLLQHITVEESTSIQDKGRKFSLESIFFSLRGDLHSEESQKENGGDVSPERVPSGLSYSILGMQTVYRMSLVIRHIFFPFRNNAKNLDPSYKMVLDLWDCLERKNLYYSEIS